MSYKGPYIIGLDMGSVKTCALICLPGEIGKLHIAGLGVAESRGWRKGVIANLDLAVLALKKAVEAAESAAGVPIDSAYVGVAGSHIHGVNSRGASTLGKGPGAQREVTREDIRNAVQMAQGIMLPEDRQMLHVLPQEFLVDSQDGIRDPLGMVGGRLEVNVHIVTASATASQNVVTAVNRAGIVVLDTVFEGLASSDACLGTDDRELGVALVDIGGGSTELVVFHQGTVRHTAVIPVGGEHFTNDIAVGLRTPIPEAEKIKKKYGCVAGPLVEEQETIEVPSVGKGRKPRVLSRQLLADIIQPRAEEIFRLVDSDIKRMGYDKSLNSGIVLTGGTALLEGLEEVAEEIFDLPVRRGDPSGVGGLVDRVSTPDFATSVGLTLYGFHTWQDKGLSRDRKKGGWAKFKDWFKEG